MNNVDTRIIENEQSIYNYTNLLAEALKYKNSNKKLLEKSKSIVEIILEHPFIAIHLGNLKEYNINTYNHSIQTASLAISIGVKLGIDSRELMNLAIASLTHDIGKCRIDGKIINKPDNLTEEEYEIVKAHSFYGYQILKDIKQIDDSVSTCVLYHHENYDGTGYPFGLKDEQIPISASIIHLCDVYDALTSERPYKKAFTKDDSINMIKSKSGIAFNPDVVETFLDITDSKHLIKKL